MLRALLVAVCRFENNRPMRAKFVLNQQLHKSTDTIIYVQEGLPAFYADGRIQVAVLGNHPGHSPDQASLGTRIGQQTPDTSAYSAPCSFDRATHSPLYPSRNFQTRGQALVVQQEKVSGYDEAWCWKAVYLICVR